MTGDKYIWLMGTAAIVYDADGVQRCGYCGEVAESATAAPLDIHYDGNAGMVIERIITTVHPCEHGYIQAGNAVRPASN